MTVLSRGARLCEQVIRESRARKGGTRKCGRPYLARRLGCTVRTVSRYLKELRESGRLEVTPPRRVKRAKGWRCEGVNVYRLLGKATASPHVTGPARLCRSRRGDTSVLPSPNGDCARRPEGAGEAPDGPLIDPTAAAAALMQLLTSGRAAA